MPWAGPGSSVKPASAERLRAAITISNSGSSPKVCFRSSPPRPQAGLAILRLLDLDRSAGTAPLPPDRPSPSRTRNQLDGVSRPPSYLGALKWRPSTFGGSRRADGTRSVRLLTSRVTSCRTTRKRPSWTDRASSTRVRRDRRERDCHLHAAANPVLASARERFSGSTSHRCARRQCGPRANASMTGLPSHAEGGFTRSTYASVGAVS